MSGPDETTFCSCGYPLPKRGPCPSCGERAGDEPVQLGSQRIVEEPEYRRSFAELLADIEAFIRRYVVLTEHQAVALALWVAHTYAISAADMTPYLRVKSAIMRSGKSRLVEVLSFLLQVRRYILSSNVSPAAVYRWLDKTPGGAVLFDETDQTWRGDKERAATLTGLINAGNRRRTAGVIRADKATGFDARTFNAFGPKVLAGIGELAHTTEDRSIPIVMVRRRRDEPIARLREDRAEAQATPIRDELCSWASTETLAALREAEPDLPEELSDRAQEAWEPLLAIADMAGGDLPARARTAALALSGEEVDADSEGERVLLLAHIRDVFADLRDRDAIQTTELLAALVDRDDGPWSEWWGRDVRDGNAKAAGRRLGLLLKPFGIRSKKVRTGDKTAQGYVRSAFVDVWSRYLGSPNGTNGTNGTPQVAATSLVPFVPSVPTGDQLDHVPGSVLSEDEREALEPTMHLLGAVESAAIEHVRRRRSEGVQGARIAYELHLEGYVPPPGFASWDSEAVAAVETMLT